MRKYNLIIILIVLFYFKSDGQSPDKISYQAVIRNSGNNLLQNTQVGMRINILQGSSSGTAVYVETQFPLSNNNALITIEIGSGTIINGNFSSINWGSGQYFIKTEIDPNGGTNYSITSTSQLLSVPYALFAKSAGTISGTWSHQIGELYEGGIIVFVERDSTGIEHGLIVSINDLSINATWGLSGTDVFNCESTWDGISNSNAIMTAGGANTGAAGICHSNNAGGYTDWYLPSLEEFHMIYSNRYIINKKISTTSGDIIGSDSWYWTSTEFNSFNAWVWDIAVSGSDYTNKTSQHHIRAIRRF